MTSCLQVEHQQCDIVTSRLVGMGDKNGFKTMIERVFIGGR